MTCSILGSDTVGAALVRQLARGGTAIGIANTHGPVSVETMAKQLGARITAMTSQDGPGTDVIILAIPLRACTAPGDELFNPIATILNDAMNTDDISPDELMGILNAAR